MSSAVFQGQTSFATGWGAIYEGGPVSNDLLEVPLPLLSDNACKSYYQPYGYPINPLVQVCAGIAGNNKDTCQGDSGGPLVNRASDGRWYLTGITSFGIGCGNTGVYTRTSAYQNWIVQTLNSN
jgi:secreted trypsin-like serine protease